MKRSGLQGRLPAYFHKTGYAPDSYSFWRPKTPAIDFVAVGLILVNPPKAHLDLERLNITFVTSLYGLLVHGCSMMQIFYCLLSVPQMLIHLSGVRLMPALIWPFELEIAVI
jgi:hypothetical protein